MPGEIPGFLKLMPLTPDNMESRAGLMSRSIFRDIARMDYSQLNRYTRMAFTGKRDLAFLPEPFWDYWFEYGKHGETSDGRESNNPAVFLTGLHNMLASIAVGRFRVGGDEEEQPDFAYRPRFRRVLKGILDECIRIAAKPSPETVLLGRSTPPTREQMDLASYGVEAVGAIQTLESFNAYYLRTGKHERSQRELATIPATYTQHLREDLIAMDTERAELIRRSTALISSGRFGQLKLKY